MLPSKNTISIRLLSSIGFLSIFIICTALTRPPVQDPYLDSLRLATNAGDSIRILNELAWNFMRSSPDDAFRYAQKANELATLHEDLKGRSTSLVRMSNILDGRSQLDSSIVLLRRSLNIEQVLGELFLGSLLKFVQTIGLLWISAFRSEPIDLKTLRE
ncbi:MAG: hypothetical protein AAFO69_16750, partial [Bacteroidota bacterium]